MKWRRYATMLVDENRWRGHRYGIDEGLIDFGRGQIVPYADLFEEILELIDEDADYFNCRDEVAHGRRIIAGGTSAHRQLLCYKSALESGAGRGEALEAVVDLLVEDTLSGVVDHGLEVVEV